MKIIVKNVDSIYFLRPCTNQHYFNIVVGDYINTKNTTFDFNFDLYQAGYTKTLKSRKAVKKLLLNY